MADRLILEQAKTQEELETMKRRITVLQQRAKEDINLFKTLYDAKDAKGLRKLHDEIVEKQKKAPGDYGVALIEEKKKVFGARTLLDLVKEVEAKTKVVPKVVEVPKPKSRIAEINERLAVISERRKKIDAEIQKLDQKMKELKEKPHKIEETKKKAAEMKVKAQKLKEAKKSAEERKAKEKPWYQAFMDGVVAFAKWVGENAIPNYLLSVFAMAGGLALWTFPFVAIPLVLAGFVWFVATSICENRYGPGASAKHSK
jgi:DNA repair ATPase RecN